MTTNQTKANILRKRKLKQRKRRLRIFRLLVLLVLMALVGTAMIFLTYNIYSWGSNAYQELRSMYQGYEERREARMGVADEKFNGYTNVLILGIDEGANQDEAYERRADTIMVLSLENETGRVRVITIPRGTWIQEPHTGYQGRISNLYAAGGAPIMVRAVSQLLGISIHQYVDLDMNAFAQIIDTLGGIDVYVEEEMNYVDPEAELSIHLSKGYQHMDGETAQKYLRYRSNDLGDVGRIQRQQKFVKTFYQKLLQLETLPKLPAVADIFQNSLTTSAEVFDSAHLANVLRRLSSEQPMTVMLPGDSANGDDTVWVADMQAVQDKIGEMFPNADPAGTE